MSVIAEFSDTSGIVVAGAGYEIIGNYQIDTLRELIDKIKPGVDIQVSRIPHNEGGYALMFRPKDADAPHWLCICPARYTSSGRVQTMINRILHRGE